MNMLFSPATVPIPPSIPWPSNFNAQRYLPPKEFFDAKQVHKNIEDDKEEKSTEDPSLRRNLNSPTTQPPSFKRRNMNMQSPPDSIEKSIKESMAKNSAMFASAFQFNFPAMPDIDGLVKSEIAKIKVNFLN